MAWTYMLRCSDDSFYVGSCRNLEYRMWQHSTGHGSTYTSKRMPVELVFAEEFESIPAAYAREKQIQGWSRRKRLALIDSAYDALPELSKKDFSAWMRRGSGGGAPPPPLVE